MSEVNDKQRRVEFGTAFPRGTRSAPSRPFIRALTNGSPVCQYCGAEHARQLDHMFPLYFTVEPETIPPVSTGLFEQVTGYDNFREYFSSIHNAAYICEKCHHTKNKEEREFIGRVNPLPDLIAHYRKYYTRKYTPKGSLTKRKRVKCDDKTVNDINRLTAELKCLAEFLKREEKQNNLNFKFACKVTTFATRLEAVKYKEKLFGRRAKLRATK